MIKIKHIKVKRCQQICCFKVDKLNSKRISVCNHITEFIKSNPKAKIFYNEYIIRTKELVHDTILKLEQILLTYKIQQNNLRIEPIV